MKYDVNKLRGYGLRYIVCDQDGQLWAMERMPTRSEKHPGHWRIADEFLPPERPPNLHCIIPAGTHTVVCTNPVAEEELNQKTRRHYWYYISSQRAVCEPLSDCPFELAWDDEPFDLVANGIVAESDMKIWPDPPNF